MALALAVDLGGTKVEAALVGPDAVIVPGTRSRATTGADATASQLAAALDTVVRHCRESSAWSEVVAAGVGAAGPIDLDAGTTSPINLPAARGFAIVDAVRRSSGLGDVALRLDGTCIALAEAWSGAARGVRDAIVFVVSTGVGGGILSGGRLLAGHAGNAGHLGQLVVDHDAADVVDGTVEGIACGPRTVAWARRRGWDGASGEDLARAYAVADPLAVAAVTRSANAVGVGVANAATLLDLELAVVGGGFSFVADDYPDLIAASVRAHAVNEYASRIRVVRAERGADAPLVGAGALVHRPDLYRP